MKKNPGFVFINFIVFMGPTASRGGGLGDAARDTVSAGGSRGGNKTRTADALSSPSATRGSNGSRAQAAPDAITVTAASQRDGSGSGSGSGTDMETADKGTGGSGAGVNAASPSPPTTCGILPRNTRSRTSTYAVEFPAVNQASGRVPADVRNSRQASEIDAIDTSTTPSPSTAGDDTDNVTQPDDCMVTMAATSDRGDNSGRADTEASDTSHGSSSARINATSTSSSTTSGVLPLHCHSWTSTCAVEFPAGNQASGRVPANVRNSRQTSDITAIGTSATPSPSAAGDTNANVTKPGDSMDVMMSGGQDAPRPPPAAQPERPQPGPSSLLQPSPAGQPSVPTHGPSSNLHQPQPHTTAGDDGTKVTQLDDYMDPMMYGGQSTPQPPPDAQPELPQLGPSSLQRPPSAGQPSVPKHSDATPPHENSRYAASPSPATWPQSPGGWQGTDQTLDRTQTRGAPLDHPEGATAALPRATLALGMAQAGPAAPRMFTATPVAHLRGALAPVESDIQPEQLHVATDTTRYYGGLDSCGTYGTGLGLPNRGRDAPVEIGPQPRDEGREPVCQVFITTPAGRTVTLDVGTTGTTLAAVKTRICSAANIPPDRQRLAFAGKPLLQDERTLGDYGIREHSTLDVLDRLCGGMPSTKTATDDSAAMDTDGAKVPVPAAKPSLTAWAKWVQGPYQTLLRNASFAEQLDTWEIDFLEALTEEGVPEGAVAAMTTRAGLNMEPTEATRAMAAYRGRKHLQPDFVQGVFKKVATTKGDAAGAHASGAPPAPPAVHPSIGEWAKWVAGPFTTITNRPSYAGDLDGWEVDMEEYLVEVDATDEQLATLAHRAGVDADRTFLVRALGAHAARKHLRPNLQAMQFQPVSQPDQHLGQCDDVAPEQSRMREIREIVALLSAQKLDMEQMRQSLIPPLTTAEIDKFLAEALRYAWMTTLAAALKETAMDDPTRQWSGGKLETATWRVINEELRAKRQGRQSAPTVQMAHQQQPLPVATPYQGFVQQQAGHGSGTVCFSCGGRGHLARHCPMRAQAGQVQQVGGQTLWVSGNQAFDLSGVPPAPCNRCGQMH